MPKSLQNGDYRLVMVFESNSRANAWYRVLRDGQTGALSCDCRAWIFNVEGRACVHTRTTTRLLQPTILGRSRLAGRQVAENHPLIEATQTQWPGLLGTWSIKDQVIDAERKPYRMIALRLTLASGAQLLGAVAFAQAHLPTTYSMTAGVAGWAGFALAAEVARLGGFPLAGQPPAHFRATGRGATRRTGDGSISLQDILQVGERRNLGDGLTPAMRAENTLRLFLGPLYATLEQQCFIDVSSQRYPQRVYRLRRDPGKQRVRRVRIFERGVYTKDFCIVPAQPVPEADHWLTVFLGLLSDELRTLQVVKSHNIFQPCSDGSERETVQAVWGSRAAA